MKRLLSMSMLSILALAACSTHTPAANVPPHDPQPAIAASNAPADALQPDAFDAAAPASVAEAAKAREGGGHEGHTIRETTPGHDHEQAPAVYACPMHPEVTSGEPGKCPKCGMELVRKRP